MAGFDEGFPFGMGGLFSAAMNEDMRGTPRKFFTAKAPENRPNAKRKGESLSSIHFESGATVDGSEIPNNHLGCIKP